MALVSKTTKTIFVAPQAKFKKRHKGVISSQSFNSRNTVHHNATIGIKAKESARVPHRQGEHVRRSFVRKFKKANISFKQDLIPKIPVSQKSIGTRMGKGKGGISFWIANSLAGEINVAFILPYPTLNILYYTRNVKKLTRNYNFNSKLVLNSHFMQETANIIQQTKNYRTCKEDQVL